MQFYSSFFYRLLEAVLVEVIGWPCVEGGSSTYGNVVQCFLGHFQFVDVYYRCSREYENIGLRNRTPFEFPDSISQR